MFKLFSSVLLSVFFSLAVASDDMTDPVSDSIRLIQKQWGIIKYQMPENEQAEKYQELLPILEQLKQDYPDRAEPLIFEAVVLSSYAGSVGGIKSITRALPAVKKAHKSLLQAEEIDETAMDGSVKMSLGALYYQVPGWPIGFGDKKKARRYLSEAMNIRKNKLEIGYFYGDFLYQQGEYAEAEQVLRQALESPPMKDRPVVDAGRREDVAMLLQEIQQERS